VENKWINKVFAFLKKFNIKNDRKLAIFLICVGIATFFWFLNALEKEYNVEISFPVEYTNLPNNKVLANNLPDHFVLEVRSFGFTLLRYKLSMAFSPLVFNVNDFTGKMMEDSKQTYYAVPSRQFRNRLADQVSNEINITGIQPDTIFFRFDQVVSKKVKVVHDINYSLKKQHFLTGNIDSDPDSVTVLGPKSFLDTLQVVNTVIQNFKALDKLIQKSVELKKIEKLEFSPKRVTISIPVEEYTEKQLTIPIAINNLPDGVHVNLFPAQVKVNFMIALSRFAKVTPQDFKASVSYEDLLKNLDYLPVQIEEKPLYLESVNFTPKKIEYLIEK
jgi:hypothetical protein